MGTYTGSDKRLQYLFQNGGGGGGTTVIANPQGEATDTLNKLQVESTIYSVSGGSGSGSANNVKQLWSGALNTLNGTLTLSESYKHFDLLIVKWSASSNVNYYQGNEVIPTAEIVENQTYQFGDSFYRSTGQFCQMAFSITNETTLTLDQIQINGTNAGVTIQAVYGLCVGGGFIGLGDIYSTDEKQIGQWEDGRPLYQKTYIWDNTNGISGNTATIPIDNTIRVIDYIAHVYNSTNGRTYFIPHARDKGSSFMVMDGYLYLVTNDSWGTAYSPFFITIKYTKTTDTPDSGIYIPSWDDLNLGFYIDSEGYICQKLTGE